MKNPLSRSIRSFFAIVLSCSLVAFVPQQAAYARSVDKQVLTTAAVASPDRYGTEAAQRILKKGGNAVDAAVATAFALAVTYPEAGNIGGGGFMTIFMGGKSYFLDYREVAPGKATETMYLDKNGNVIKNMSLFSHQAAAVPGTVDGLWKVQKRFGRLSWKEVMAPAIEYAEKGFVVSELLAARYQETLPKAPTNGHFAEYFGSMKAGELFRQPELAATLKRIANKGVTEFYQGKTAQLITEEMKQGQGLISMSDLKKFQSTWREPIVADWNGMKVITAPPPSSGGIGLLQLLVMKQFLAKEFAGVEPNSAQYVHLLAEIEKRVFADRAEYMGDPKFVSVPVAKLLDPIYLARRANEVNTKAITPTALVKPGLALPTEKLQTTHYSVVDKWGNAVSNTYTLNGWFGSAVVVKGAGFILNNEMDDFSSKPGVANQYGVVGKDANAIAPFKKPLSSMSPTIITKDNQVKMVLGTPGGSRIFTAIFQVISNVYDNKMNLNDAVSAPRYHHQLLPENTIFIEPYQKIVPAEVKDPLEKMGYIFYHQDFNGDIEAIQVNNNIPEAVADPRARGAAAIVK